MQAGMEARMGLKDWRNAALSACNLARLKLKLGRLHDAASDGQINIEFIDGVKYPLLHMSAYAVAANILHQCGKINEATKLFEKAEDLQVRIRAKITYRIFCPKCCKKR